MFFLQDHIERGTLDLKTLKFRILDEADEMLNMGFVDDVELILGMDLLFTASALAFHVVKDLSMMLCIGCFELDLPSFIVG